MTGQEALERAIVGLITPPYNTNLQAKPFYAHFLQACNREFTTEDKIPTVGVYITDKINLIINEKFFLSLTALQRISILEHEVLHLLMKHLTRFKPKYHFIWNMACDIAINQYINHLPKDCLTPQKYKLPTGKESEFYYSELLKNAKRIGISMEGDNKGKGHDTVDDHSVWDKSNSNKDLSKAVVKDATQKSIKSTKDYGSLPSKIQQEIDKILNESMVNWKRELNRFINRATMVNVALTRKRPNRRYPAFEGNKNVYKLKILIGLDTSGSIDDKTLAEFFGEIEKIKSLGFDIHIAECDCSLGNTYPYKRPPKYVSGRGGTAFEPVFEFAKKHKPDIVVYLTDGYANTNFKYRIPTLWVITPCSSVGQNDFKFGKVVKMEKRKRRV